LLWPTERGFRFDSHDTVILSQLAP
jgi:hypothetical protein